MKTLLAVLCCLGFAVAGFGQDDSAVQPALDQPASQVQPSQGLSAPPVQASQDLAPQAGTTANPPFTSDELDQLLGPIALYPDELLGLILPASTVPSDIVVADRYLDQGGDPAQIDNQPWDDSVKGLVHYPDLLKWLDQNIAWTTQVGTAYLAQPQDVMNSIQQLRARAKADGTLLNSDQQTVGVDDAGDITITPTNPDTLYVPQYDPNAAYDDNYTLDDGPVISYGTGYPVGPWLYYWPDWRHRRVYRGDWHHWRDFRGGAGFANDPATRVWSPRPGQSRAQYLVQTGRPTIFTAKPLQGVTVAHPRRTPPAQPNYVAPPQRDFTGRGETVQPPERVIVARPVAVPPQAFTPPRQVVVQPPAPPHESVVAGYGRGSDASAASQRGQESRQAAYGAQAPVYQGASSGGGGGRSVVTAAPPPPPPPPPPPSGGGGGERGGGGGTSGGGGGTSGSGQGRNGH